jgi:hypothetical protein
VAFEDAEAGFGGVAGGLLAAGQQCLGGGVVGCLGDGDAVQCGVELAVAAFAEPVRAGAG